jgi:hypothetical protein
MCDGVWGCVGRCGLINLTIFEIKYNGRLTFSVLVIFSFVSFGFILGRPW